MLLEPFQLGSIEFRNRVFRSSMGGRMAAYDGTVTSVWKNFEKRFADGGVGAVVSTTLDVNKRRESPAQYPPICADHYVPALRRYIREIQRTGCRYIVQIGDPGYQTQAGLFPEPDDCKSSSDGIDLIYGYGSRRIAMTEEEIGKVVTDFADAAERVVATGADGLEITASKGYLIHQFLNPGINRRTDRWGGDLANRARLLDEILRAVRARIGRGFLLGVRLAAVDHNQAPLNFRWPPVARRHRRGNTLADTLEIGRRIKPLVDYLHVDSGYGFIHPRVTPGRFPYDEARIFFDMTRHLSGKASFRAWLFRTVPAFVGRRLFNRGWRYQEGINLEYAAAFKREVGLPVVVSGGFQRRSSMERALADGSCDAIAVARALLANPDLVQQFEKGRDLPVLPCTHCNRCAARTATSPLGCYEPARFESADAMERQILAFNRPDEHPMDPEEAAADEPTRPPRAAC